MSATFPRALGGLLLATVTACSTACSTATRVPDDWTTLQFGGGTLAVPPSTTQDPRPVRPEALVSRGLADGGREVGRIDVYREELPRRSGYASLAEMEQIPCPGTGDAESEEFRPGQAGVNVFEARLSAAGEVVDDDIVICASYAGTTGAPSVQLVLQGTDESLPESLWRPVVESLQLDG